MLSSALKHTPTVCAVKNDYQILVPVNTSTVLWVRVGGNTYYDDSNGILRSDTDLHRVTVPASVLDAAGEYTVCWKEVIERKPYFPTMGEEQSATFAFRPVKGDPIRAYMIVDGNGWDLVMIVLLIAATSATLLSGVAWIVGRISQQTIRKATGHE